MITLLLLEKIVSLYLILVMGYIAVKAGVVRSEDSKVLSTICLYIITPCVIISSFNVEHSPEVLKGLGFTILAALIATLISFAVAEILKKPLKLTVIDKAAFEYPNVGNLIIPLVMSVLGEEYVIYTLGFIVVQLIFTWTHMKIVISGDKKLDLKKIVLNINMISIAVGMLLFAFHIKLPLIIDDAVSSLSSVIGPVSMLITGMVLGNMDLRSSFMNKRVWIASLGRLVIAPLAFLIFLKLVPLNSFVENGDLLLLIILLAAAAPTASNLTLMSQMYEKDVGYVSSINVVTTLGCMATMPLMVFLYQL